MNLRAGVLPFQWLRRAAWEGWIQSPLQDFEERQWQPASLDLRLGPVAYRMRSSFLSGQETVEKKLASLLMYEIPLAPAAVLERGQCGAVGGRQRGVVECFDHERLWRTECGDFAANALGQTAAPWPVVALESRRIRFTVFFRKIFC